MTSFLSIGDFSRATRLTAKTLRFYHRVGLLAPARIDPSNGYRFYSPEQIADAQVIRAFRSMEMPVEFVRTVLALPDASERTALIEQHLARMEARLEETRSVVASLRSLLAPVHGAADIELRSIPPLPVLLIRATIDLADLGDWFTRTMDALGRVAEASGLRVVGPPGGLWQNELFLHERGEAALYLPIERDDCIRFDGVSVETLPAVELAVATHRGTDDGIAGVYAALGEYVAARGIGAGGPVRETYVSLAPTTDDAAVTDIGWPIERPAPTALA